MDYFVRPCAPPWGSLLVRRARKPAYNTNIEHQCLEKSLGFDKDTINLIRARLSERDSFEVDDLLNAIWEVEYSGSDECAFHRRRATLRIIFDAYDADFDGYISLDEYLD